MTDVARDIIFAKTKRNIVPAATDTIAAKIPLAPTPGQCHSAARRRCSERTIMVAIAAITI
jgi:hypothetical protein